MPTIPCVVCGKNINHLGKYMHMRPHILRGEATERLVWVGSGGSAYYAYRYTATPHEVKLEEVPDGDVR